MSDVKSGLIARSRGAGGSVNPLRIASGLSGSLPPSSLLVVGMITVQLGAALAINLFSALGPSGVVFLRVGFAALMLLALYRPWRSHGLGAVRRGGILVGARRSDYLTVVAFGLTLAINLFSALGPSGVVFLRVGFAALMLLAFYRPWRSHGLGAVGHGGVLAGARRSDYLTVVAFGLTLAMMNLTFYAALDRIPLGIAVTIEFIGPLSVAVTGSRRALDVLWVALAVGGILLLAPLGLLGAAPLDPLGLLLALGAGACWALYILLSARVGRAFSGGTGLSLAMAVGAVALLPVGIAGAGSALLNPQLLLLGAGVALLSSVVPYSLEMAALRRISPSAFGVFMSLEPAIAALVGWLVLRESLELRAIIALVLVTTAAIGATRTGKRAP